MPTPTNQPEPVSDKQRLKEHLQDSIAHLKDAFKWMTHAQEKATGHNAGILDCGRSMVESLHYDLSKMLRQLDKEA